MPSCKMGCIKTFLAILLFVLTQFCYSQYIKTGESLPDPVFKNVIGYRSDSLKLSEFRGKLVILDFWGHFCSSCLKALPKIDSLQKEFQQQLQFIMVNKESKESTILLKEKRKYLVWPEIPMITGDSILHSLFPPNGYPYHIWIDREGKLAYASGGYNTTRENLLTYFSNTKLALKSFYDRPAKDAVKTDIIFGSFLTKGGTTTYTEKYDQPGNLYRAELRSSVKDLFMYAYSEPDGFNFYPDYSIDLQVDSPSHYIFPKDHNLIDNWVAKYSYDYHLVLPKQAGTNHYKKMQEDLQQFFDIRASIVQRKVRGYVLKKLKGFREMGTNGGEPFSNMESIGEGTDSICRITNMPFKELASHIKASLWLHFPFEDRTGITGNMDINLSCKNLYPLNIPALRKELNQYQLDLVETLIHQPVLLLQQKPRE